MAKTYAQIAQQIELLKQQADALKKKESVSVIARIKEAIAFYGLTPADLGFIGGSTSITAKRSADTAGTAAKRAPATRKKTAKRPSTIRFRDAAGNAWSGMGRKPGWLVDGLAAGKSLADFTVTPTSGDANNH